MEYYEDYDFLFKIVMAGNCAVGKSCLVQRYLQEAFKDTYRVTVGVEFFARNMAISTPQGVKNIKLQIWDTSG
jgi:GTPase SAR1 family protein